MGFIKGRYFFNIRRLCNIIYCPFATTDENCEVIISLDAEKAFDQVERNYLFKCLEYFKFVPKFISWIKTLYTLPTAAVRTNNNLSSYFQLQYGTRQGSPLSPLLFAVAMEPLALALWQNPKIKGSLRAGLEHKVSLYADNMLLFLSDPHQSIPILLSILSKFGEKSGYKINVQKRELMPVSSSSKQHVNSNPFKVNLKKIKYLGLWVTRNQKDLYQANYQPLLSSLRQDLDKFLYLFQCIPIYLTKSFFTNLNSQISQFIWNKKQPRVRKEMLHLPRTYRLVWLVPYKSSTILLGRKYQTFTLLDE